MNRRELAKAALALGALTAAPAAFAASELDGEAVRTSADAIRLSWTGGAAPVAILASSDPDAQRPLMREVIPAAQGGAAELPFPASPRPYFLLDAGDGRRVRIAERLLPLQGGRNFRDIGGWRAADGRQVRWGRIYRSGVMTGLTPADLAYVSALGIEAICDLRSRQERASAPNPFLASEGPPVDGSDYDMARIMQAMPAVQTREAAITAFAASYITFTDILTPQYTDLFARLVRRERIAFNCSAGKDRTGMGAALVLSVLGAPRETIVADYALTQVYTPPARSMKTAPGGLAALGVTQAQMEAFARTPPEVLKVMTGSDPEIMRQALEMLDRQHGGPVQLTKDRFGLDDAKIAWLQANYLI
jgi:protein-tyrosine phosphatase